MKNNFHYHHRRSQRLKGYNYARAGSYFVTLICKNRFPLFGEIVKGKMNLNEFGIIARNEWLHTPEIRPNVSLGVFIVMPDHLHGIIIIREEMNGRGELHTPHLDTPNTPTTDSPITKIKFESGRGVLHTPLPDSNSSFRSPSQTLGAIIRGYMGSVTKQINALRNTPVQKIW